MKRAMILDGDYGTFALEYDNTLGQKNQMRLDAVTYEKAIIEAKEFLEIQEDGLDSDGDLWEIQ